MNEPTEECVTDFWTNGTLRNLPVSSQNPRFIEAASILRGSCNDKGFCRDALLADYSQLFADKGKLLAPAYESTYLDYEQGREERASAFYDSYGWESRHRKRSVDDHLGIELLFLTTLINKLMQIEDYPCRREMKKEIRRFIDLHLLSWVPRWNLDLQQNARTSCYKGIGILIFACIEDIYGLMA